MDMSLDEKTDLQRKYTIARLKYTLMIVICVLEFMIGIGISLPNAVGNIRSLIRFQEVTLNSTTPISKVYTDPLFRQLYAKNDYGSRAIYSFASILLLGFLFSLRSLSVVLNNIYIERKEISNFKVWIKNFLIKVIFLLILGIFRQTLVLELLISLIFLFCEYYMLVKAVKNLRQSLKLKHFDVCRDCPNSHLVAKSYRDFKRFSLTSKIGLVFIFFYLLAIILWVHAETSFTIAFYFPTFLRHVYGFSVPLGMIVNVETAEYVNQVIHIMQNITLCVGNVLLLLLCGVHFMPIVIKLCCRCCFKKNIYSYSCRTELITPILEANDKEMY